MKISIGQKNHEKYGGNKRQHQRCGMAYRKLAYESGGIRLAASSVSRRPSRFAVRASLRVSRGGSGMVASSVAMKRRNGVAAGAKKKKKKMAWRRRGKIIAAARKNGGIVMATTSKMAAIMKAIGEAAKMKWQ
jgi:hypothetical protein